ncbi:MAG TPA: hypothetical protein VGC85_06385 [Chthoniobacterales bacterium]
MRRLQSEREALQKEVEQLRVRLEANHSPFFHYQTTFPAEELIRRHAVPDLKPDAAHRTNFLGVRINPKFVPAILQGTENTVESVPIPANWHADIAEWAAALRAVELAQSRFTMIELGCGWGCWMNNTGVAARRLGLEVELIGVEGDAAHIGFAHEACATNGFASDQIHLYRGIAAAQSGVALFPRQTHGGTDWGLAPVFGANEDQRAAAARAGTHDELPLVALAEIIGARAKIDLLHIDIQGGEADLIARCIDLLCDKVAYLVIGTHSREIEGRIFENLLQSKWLLEIERPAIFNLTPAGPHVTVDGVQGWRNPRLFSGAGQRT